MGNKGVFIFVELYERIKKEMRIGDEKACLRSIANKMGNKSKYD